MLHILMHNPEVQKSGFVILANSRGLSAKTWNPRWSSQGPLLIRAFPVKTAVAHICNPAQGFHLLSQAIKAVLSVSQRERFLLHNDKGEGMLESLSKHRLPKHCVPVSLGGTLIVSGDTFVEDRLTIESGTLESNECILPSLLLSHTVQAGSIATSGIESQLENNNTGTGKIRREDLSEKPNTLGAMQEKDTNNTLKRKYCTDSGNENKQAQISEKKAVKDNARKYGASGDPRMNIAVQVKIHNPKLPLVTCLTRGGFVFNGLAVSPGTNVGSVKDMDGITLYQRRNQLMRRLRYVKGKGSKTNMPRR